jgi:hypothetical protein
MEFVMTDFAKETLAAMGFSWVSSVRKSGRNELTRVYGFSINELTADATLLIHKDDSARLLECLENTAKMAFVVTDPATFKTIQIKGEYRLHRDATEDEIALIQNVFQPAQNDAMTNLWGMPDNALTAWRYLPTVTIEMTCKEVFDQTPRQHATNQTN